MTLTEFLAARIAEVEADVEKRGTWAVGHSERCIFEGGYEGTASCDCGAVTRALADCEAKRQIVAELSEFLTLSYDIGANDEAPTLLYGIERQLRHLALPYADHPGYREEWKP